MNKIKKNANVSDVNTDMCCIEAAVVGNVHQM